MSVGGEKVEKRKICIGLNESFGLSYAEQLRLIKKIGFDGFFTKDCPEISELSALAQQLGLIYQSLHADFHRAAHIWRDGIRGSNAVISLMSVISTCAANKIPILVVHPFIGFDKPYLPTKQGLDNFRQCIDYAAEVGVNIAFENVEGQPYLEALMQTFRDYKNVGFCWDSGHELCYNKGTDMLALYGERLIATHLNDNLGISGDNISPNDDLHLLPFDGITDWGSACERLKKCGYAGPLTFEVKTHSKPDRHENDNYAAMPLEKYLTETFSRACKIRSLLDEK